MTEYDELGRLERLRKASEIKVPKETVKKRKVRSKRKARKVALKKWSLNISDD
ncbi:hypothetical protein [Pedobacter sp. Leaf194]|uniref:hypothetical protein n=1 Tax=Pedobacter sp. Leaf194 TaxID=1736297 RepID=UPI0012FB0466|nr:hypothetical protein [Pedobacter sp. Leaf194]